MEIVAYTSQHFVDCYLSFLSPDYRTYRLLCHDYINIAIIDNAVCNECIDDSFKIAHASVCR